MSRFLDSVDPSMGTGRGHCLIGPYRPFSLVRLGPDMISSPSTTGYTKDEATLGFSHLHLSGTGGFGRYGNIRIMPYCGPLRECEANPFFQIPYQKRADAQLTDENSSVGCYRAKHHFSGTDIELTSTPHTGVHRYTFSRRNENASVMLDAGCSIAKPNLTPGQISPLQSWEMPPVSCGGFIEMPSDTVIRGRGDSRGGWGNSMPHSVYFHIEFSHPIQKAKFVNNSGIVPAGVLKIVCGESCCGFFDFGKIKTLEIRCGISFVSIANAENHVAEESRGRTFETIIEESRNEWEKIFEKYRVCGGTPEQQKIYYTMLYRLFCMPTDLGINSEHPFWKSGRRAFTDFYCLWDSVRNANSYFNLFEPELARDILNSLLDEADHYSWLPDAHIAARYAFMQSGCSANIIFSEACIKRVSGVDYAKALEFMIRDSCGKSPDPAVVGRFEDWNKLGYVSTEVPKASISRTIEYSFYDWCIARLAEKLNRKDTAETFYKRSKGVWQLWSRSARLFSMKKSNGELVTDYDLRVRQEQDIYNSPACYEATSAIWSLCVFHDFPGLIERIGGPEAFREYLDWVWENQWGMKEIKMHIPHLYSVAGYADQTADRVHEALEKSYSLEYNGLQDDEDAGCHSGWFLWNSIGLYPLIGHDFYILIPPVFTETEIKMAGNGKLHISSDTTEGKKYFKSVVINGQNLDRAWLRHSEIADGADLHLILSDIPCGFGNSNPLMDELKKISV